MTKSKNLTIKLSGGIGNQLFQYSAGRYLTINCNFKVKYEIDFQGKFHAGSDLNTLMELGLQKVTNSRFSILASRSLQLHGFLARRISLYGTISKNLSLGYFSSEIGYDPILERLDWNNKVYGYFQSKIYAEVVRDEIRTKIQEIHKSEQLALLLELSRRINPIMVHIRRGDYLSHRRSIGLLSHEYFKDAINRAKVNNSIREVWIFTDDKQEALKLLSCAEIRADKVFGEEDGLDSIQTLELMSTARNIVISNSTYSWWAAYLGSENAFVYYPRSWYRSLSPPKELIPTSWIPVRSSWEE